MLVVPAFVLIRFVGFDVEPHVLPLFVNVFCLCVCVIDVSSTVDPSKASNSISFREHAPSAGILIPTLTWSPNFTTPHTPSSFPAHPTTHSPSTGFHTFPTFNSQHGSATASHSRKRKQASDENLLVFGSLDSSAKKRKCPLSLKADFHRSFCYQERRKMEFF